MIDALRDAANAHDPDFNLMRRAADLLEQHAKFVNLYRSTYDETHTKPSVEAEMEVILLARKLSLVHRSGV